MERKHKEKINRGDIITIFDTTCKQICVALDNMVITPNYPFLTPVNVLVAIRTDLNGVPLNDTQIGGQCLVGQQRIIAAATLEEKNVLNGCLKDKNLYLREDTVSLANIKAQDEKDMTEFPEGLMEDMADLFKKYKMDDYIGIRSAVLSIYVKEYLTTIRDILRSDEK